MTYWDASDSPHVDCISSHFSGANPQFLWSFLVDSIPVFVRVKSHHLFCDWDMGIQSWGITSLNPMLVSILSQSKKIPWCGTLHPPWSTHDCHHGAMEPPWIPPASRDKRAWSSQWSVPDAPPPPGHRWAIASSWAMSPTAEKSQRGKGRWPWNHREMMILSHWKVALNAIYSWFLIAKLTHSSLGPRLGLWGVAIIA